MSWGSFFVWLRECHSPSMHSVGQEIWGVGFFHSGMVHLSIGRTNSVQKLM